ncbi:MAG: adenine phosphoribosyltransferase [Flavobacteriales bacterium]|nr:adenine phosphoribosyltransferase [Flavobacteriales bacterium]MDG2246583.1 adenine phosphoribosyltransferase [Flavobacteriales bacterium]
MTIEEQIKEAVRTIPDFPKPGISFKDITTLFLNPALCNEVLDELVKQTPEGTTAIVGVESRGFIFGFPLALRLGIPFIPLRKAGKLPGDTWVQSYDLEYGSAQIEMHKNALTSEDKVVVHDDLLATGGTAAAAVDLVKKAGAQIQGFSFILGLDILNGEKLLQEASRNITILARC